MSVMRVLRTMMTFVFCWMAGVLPATAAPAAPDMPAAGPPSAGKLPSAVVGAPPGLRRLTDTYLRDTSICSGPDGTWYMTGTSNPPDGIRLWKSRDRDHAAWEPLGIVWKPGASPWHKPYMAEKCPLWAPEVHFINGTFWLTYSFPGWDHWNPKNSGCGLLKSSTGKPEGPYVDVQPDERLGDEIDASLFQDDDGTVYFLWHNSKIAKMKPDMSGLAEPCRWLKTGVDDTNAKHHGPACPTVCQDQFHAGYEGISMFKAGGLYYWCASEQFEGRYSCAIATSRNIYGPYSARYEALPYCGHNNFFQDKNKQWWATYFGHDGGAPWRERPGILPVEIGADGIVHPQQRQPTSTKAAAGTIKATPKPEGGSKKQMSEAF